jgi:hypothetical protein
VPLVSASCVPAPSGHALADSDPAFQSRSLSLAFPWQRNSFTSHLRLEGTSNSACVRSAYRFCSVSAGPELPRIARPASTYLFTRKFSVCCRNEGVDRINNTPYLVALSCNRVVLIIAFKLSSLTSWCAYRRSEFARSLQKEGH